MPLKMTSDARQNCASLRFAIMNNVIWANRKTESFEYLWLRELVMFDVTSFPTILLGIGRHFKFCRYGNQTMVDLVIHNITSLLLPVYKEVEDGMQAFCQMLKQRLLKLPNTLQEQRKIIG